MKKSTLFCIFLSLFLPIKFANAATENYTLDPNHSYVLWHIDHLGFSTQTGKWPAQGMLVLDAAQPQNSKVNVTIHIDEMVTGNPELDKHLKSKAFFDLTTFPNATFVSNKVTVTGKDTANVQGMLTLHGVTKPVTLKVKLNKVGENPVLNKEWIGFSATAQLKRSDFGMTTLVPILGDNVMLNIEAEGAKS